MRVPLPEQVWIDYEPASFGSRGLAYIFDFVLRWLCILAVVLTVIFIFSLLGGTAHADLARSAPAQMFKSLSNNRIYKTAFASLILFVFLVEWSYPIYFEVFRGGATPGKRIFGLRVVDERGLRVTFRASLLRTVLGIVDLLGIGLVAFLSMIITRKSQRVGDIVAQTMVVHELPEDEPALEHPESQGAGKKLKEAEILLPLELYNVIGEYLQRKKQFSDEARTKTLRGIHRALQQSVAGIELPQTELPERKDGNDNWLADLYRQAKPRKISKAKDRRDRTINWGKVEQELEAAKQHYQLLAESSEGLSQNKLLGIAQSYQSVCQRYSYLSTFYPQTVQARKAARLVREGRWLIYGTRLAQRAEPSTGFLERARHGFYRIRWHIFASGMLGVVSALVCAFFIQINPNLMWYFLSEDTVKNLTEGHLWTENVRGVSEIASSAIVTNNIKVTLSAFALGITGGIGTVLILIMNGLHLGGIFSALTFYHQAFQLFDFIVAHGFLELSVITVAGGCGLYLGDALLHPGSLSRKAKVQLHGRQLVELLVFNAAALVIAGVVEGFISPYPEIPFSFRLVLGVCLGYFYWVYLITGRPLPRVFPRKKNVR